MRLRTEPVRVANGSDEEGVLVFSMDDRLLAVVTQLTPAHEDLAGCWFLEAGFGKLDGPVRPTFQSLDAALDWIAGHLRSVAGSALRPPAPDGS